MGDVISDKTIELRRLKKREPKWRELVGCCETHIAEYRLSGNHNNDAYYKMINRKKKLRAELMEELDGS